MRKHAEVVRVSDLLISAAMLNKRLNPFAAILALTVIASVGTLFVVQQIFETDFTYQGYTTVSAAQSTR